MFRPISDRSCHYPLLLLVTAGLCFCNLGTPSLWDIDEGHNAEAAREMLMADNWVVPTFNFQLRSDKPALLYWLQILAYRLCGVGEFAARLPSALAALVTVLITYELGRRLFDRATGFLAGLILASTVMFCAAAHFANPDALLCALTTLTLLIFWSAYRRGSRGWFVPVGMTAGLAVLAKGPVGIVLPATVTGLFLLWEGQLRRLWDRRLVLGILAFLAVAAPWYAWVGLETRMEFLRDFIGKHNLGRFRDTMEGHRGPLYYYAGWLLVGFAPWSVFFGPALWAACRRSASAEPESEKVDQARSALRFLACWIGVYFLFFSASATKLPNYILPLYPPMAVFIGRFLNRWRTGAVSLPPWVMRTSLAGLVLIGLGTSAGLICAGGVVDVPLIRGRQLPGLEEGAILGVVLVFGAAVGLWCLRRQLRTGLVTTVAVASVLYVATLAAWGTVAVDAFKSPRPLVEACRNRLEGEDIRVACYRYYQPSLVFYWQREIQCFDDEAQALEFLRYPLPVYLFLPAQVWDSWQGKLQGPHHVLGRHADLYRNCQVVVVTNQ
jgi:4-amino-4-deoxy-L-arabinose transferase-like glycosyltransferase